MSQCIVCGYKLKGYNEKCDTCGACINNGHKCACEIKAEEARNENEKNHAGRY